jgi:predicted amidophosphoribosyltransferase
MKDIASRKKKAAALMECFYINDEITDSDAYDVLVIDDLCASGASLSAATRVLRSYSKVRKVFVAVFSRTR